MWSWYWVGRLSRLILSKVDAKYCARAGRYAVYIARALSWSYCGGQRSLRENTWKHMSLVFLIIPHITVGFLFSCLHPAFRRPPSAVRRPSSAALTVDLTQLISHTTHLTHNSSLTQLISSHTQLISHTTHLTHNSSHHIIHHSSHTHNSSQLISHNSSHTTHLTHLISQTCCLAGAVHRAFWRRSGADWRRSGRGYLLRGRRSTESLLKELRRGLAPPWPRLLVPEHPILITIIFLVSKNIDIDLLGNIDYFNIFDIDFQLDFFGPNIDSNIDFNIDFNIEFNIDFNIDILGLFLGLQKGSSRVRSSMFDHVSTLVCAWLTWLKNSEVACAERLFGKKRNTQSQHQRLELLEKEYSSPRDFLEKEKHPLEKGRMSKNKGGARHFAKPAIDPGVLLKILRNHTDNIKDLGPYETISKTGAVNPKGLLECRSFLQDIIEVVPTCEIAPQVLRTSLMNLLSHNVSLNATRFNGLTWANIKAERITVLMAHCRKVAREKNQQRLCMAKLTSHEYLQLQTLISDVAIKDEDSLGKGKNLKRRTSDAPLDSDGFPKLLQSPEMEKKRKALTKRAMTKKPSPKGCGGGLAPAVLGPWKNGRRKKQAEPSLNRAWTCKGKWAMEVCPKRSLLQNRASQRQRQRGILKKPLEKGRPTGTEKFCFLRITHAQNPKRTYLTGCHKGTTQRRLIVEVPEKWAQNHQKVVEEIKREMESKGLTKPEAVALRAKLVAKQSKWKACLLFGGWFTTKCFLGKYVITVCVTGGFL